VTGAAITCARTAVSETDVVEPVRETSELRREVDCMNRFAVFHECPLCSSALSAEHAHFRCTSCGWRDSCCD